MYVCIYVAIVPMVTTEYLYVESKLFKKPIHSFSRVVRLGYGQASLDSL